MSNTATIGPIPPSQRGILLYYHYVPVADPQPLADWYRSRCEGLDLKGRVRVAPDGVNVTVGGDISSLKEHIEEVKRHPVLSQGGDSGSGGSSIDFKLAPSSGARNRTCEIETGFDALKVTVYKALITLGKDQVEGEGAPHLKPQDFHHMLQSASHEGAPPTVLLDARNIYETRVGHFSAPGVTTLDPRTRQLSDLPRWLDQQLDQFKDKRVLMYCTGGVRCESVSSYLRSKGQGFQDVYQLSGGIQRYLEAFPDGGLFRGENFVFDERVTVGPALGAKEVVGRCLGCQRPYGDYSARLRCGQCRLLLLVCDGCIEGQGVELCCELCREKAEGGSGGKRRRRRRARRVVGQVEGTGGGGGHDRRRVRVSSPMADDFGCDGLWGDSQQDEEA